MCIWMVDVIYRTIAIKCQVIFAQLSQINIQKKNCCILYVKIFQKTISNFRTFCFNSSEELFKKKFLSCHLELIKILRSTMYYLKTIHSTA